MKKELTYKGYSMIMEGPDEEGCYSGLFKCPGFECAPGGETFEEAKADFELFVDEHLQEIQEEKEKVESVKNNKCLFKTKVDYKGTLGTVEIDNESKEFIGHIVKTGNKYTYSGKNYEEFIEDFHSKVDAYREELKNEKIEKQFKGSFNVRIKPSMHRDAYAYASDNNMSLNKLVETAIAEKIYGYSK